MKKRIQLALQHKDWTSAQWPKVLVLDELQSNSLLQPKEMSVNYQERNVMKSISCKQQSIRQMWWFGELFRLQVQLDFFPCLKSEIAMNGQQYLSLMKKKL